MTDLLINDVSALKATNFLLELDLQTIKERYRQDADSWTQNL